MKKNYIIKTLFFIYLIIMNKLEVIPWLLDSKFKIEVKYIQTALDLPKTIVFRKAKLAYLKSSISKFTVEYFQPDGLDEYIFDLTQKLPEFPCALFKTSNEIHVLMSFKSCIEMSKDYINKKKPFELQEYVFPNCQMVQVIRVYISGLNTSARIFENTKNFESFCRNEEKYLLSDCHKSDKAILSSSTGGLKAKATAIHYLISSMIERKYIMANISLDFIKQGEYWYFISAHSCSLLHSLSTTPKDSELKSTGFTSPREVKSRLTTSNSERHRIILPKPIITERKLEDRVDQLIDKDKAPLLKHVSYKK